MKLLRHMYVKKAIDWRVGLILTLFCAACEETEDPMDPLICTDELITIGLEVRGGSLDSYYTLQTSIGDTLEVSTPVFQDSVYPVLNDQNQDLLLEGEEDFEFIGIQQDSVVIREPFVIKSDGCHVVKVSGVEFVSL